MKSIDRFCVVLAMVMGTMIFFPLTRSEARQITVCGAGCDADSIQAAVDEAADGDAVIVSNGTYAAFTVAAKRLSITGAGDETVIDGGGSGDVITLSGGADLTLRMLRITNPGIINAGIFINQATISIFNCRLDASGGSLYNGIDIGSQGSSSLTAANTLIAGYESNGIRVDGSGSVADLRHLTLAGGSGAYFGVRRNDGTISVTNSIIADNAAYCTYGGGLSVSYTYCFNSPNYPNGTINHPGNIITNVTGPGFADEAAGDYSLIAGAPARDKGDPHERDPDNSRADMGYSGGGGRNSSVLLVPDWFGTIQEAVAASRGGDTIRLAGGSYGPVALNVTIPSPLTFEGGYAPDFGGRDPAVHASAISFLQLSPLHAVEIILDGITVTGSAFQGIIVQSKDTSLTVRNCRIFGNGSSGVSTLDAGSIRVSSSVIFDNGRCGVDIGRPHDAAIIEDNVIYGHSGPYGCGIYIASAVSADAVTNNTIHGNATGINVQALSPEMAPRVTGNRVHGNRRADGSTGNDTNGVYLLGGNIIFQDNVIRDNGGRGVYYVSPKNFVFTNNAVADNGRAGLTCEGGAGAPVIRDNVFSNNERGIEFVNGNWGASGVFPADFADNWFYGPQTPHILHTGSNPPTYGTMEPGGYGDINGPAWSSGGNVILTPYLRDVNLVLRTLVGGDRKLTPHQERETDNDGRAGLGEAVFFLQKAANLRQ